MKVCILWRRRFKRFNILGGGVCYFSRANKESSAAV